MHNFGANKRRGLEVEFLSMKYFNSRKIFD